MSGQDLHHQMISSQGISLKTSNGLYISQTIGQLSFTGSSSKKEHIIFQGFQQGVWSQYMIDVITDTNNVAVYPNPCSKLLNFSFSKAVLEPITITIHDVNGKVVYRATKKIAHKLLVLDLPQLSEAVYMVELTASNIRFNAKIIKKE